MVLSRDEILKEMVRGRIVIDPFRPDIVSGNSVDVRLGREAFVMNADGGRLEAKGKGKPLVRDVYSAGRVERMYDVVPVVTAREFRELNRVPGWGEGVVRDEDEVLVFRAGGLYLATTVEAIGTRRVEMEHVAPANRSGMMMWSRWDIVPEMKAKSTAGRLGLTVALCAGWGDVGYCSRWALEVRVAGPEGEMVPLVVGTSVGQVVFHRCTPSSVVYGGGENYQASAGATGARFLPKALKVIR